MPLSIIAFTRVSTNVDMCYNIFIESIDIFVTLITHLMTHALIDICNYFINKVHVLF